MKRQVMIVVVLAFLVLVLCACGTQEVKSSEENTGVSQVEANKEAEESSEPTELPSLPNDSEPLESKEPVEKDISEMTLDEAVDYAITKARADKLGVDISEEKGLVIVLQGKDNISLEYIRNGMLVTAKDILKIIQPLDGYNQVTIGYYFPITDKFGSTSNELVLGILFKKETLDKINFTNFLWENLPDIADSYSEDTNFFN